ncbi:MAG: protein-glutamine glutaminase family protein [Pseudomonadota bacterium]|nr:protein-glutamine glutaminase family protein [Pseudomonadota bacterium]
MKSLSFFTLLISLISLLANARPTTFAERHSYSSAIRLPGESGDDGMKRLRKAYIKVHGHSPKLYDKNAQEMAIDIDELDTSILPQWPSVGVMNSAFEYMRDSRFLFTEDKADFARRISWLYPDDGCYARAAMAVHKLEDTKLEAPYKVFIFGNLRVKTPNSPSGRVGWVYHVAPVVSVEGVAFVLDAAINPISPTPLRDWIMTMVKNSHDARVSICSTNSYTPDQACRKSTPEDDDDATADQQEYLQEEWNQLEEMNRNPEKELGDEPPWIKSLLSL